MTLDDAANVLAKIDAEYPGRFNMSDEAVAHWVAALEGFNRIDVEAGLRARLRELDAKDLTWPPSLPQLLSFVLPYHQSRERRIADAKMLLARCDTVEDIERAREKLNRIPTAVATR